MHFANALVWEIIGPAMAGPTRPCATPMTHLRIRSADPHLDQENTGSDWLGKMTSLFIQSESKVGNLHCSDALQKCNMPNADNVIE